MDIISMVNIILVVEIILGAFSCAVITCLIIRLLEELGE